MCLRLLQFRESAAGPKVSGLEGKPDLGSHLNRLLHASVSSFVKLGESYEDKNVTERISEKPIV